MEAEETKYSIKSDLTVLSSYSLDTNESSCDNEESKYQLILQNNQELDRIKETEIDFDEAPSSVVSSTVPDSTLNFSEPQPPMKAVKYVNEKIHLICKWLNCSYETDYLLELTEHVEIHLRSPSFEVDLQQNVFMACKWGKCPHRDTIIRDLTRHVYFHVYHTKLKCLGQNTLNRVQQTLTCSGNKDAVDTIPKILSDFICQWENCSKKFLNIQDYLNHIRYHCLDNSKGKNVVGGIKCKWNGCSSLFPNITKLRDHVKSHSSEKLNACPTCGNMFSSRTRLIDHFHRQIEGIQDFTCGMCLKKFSSQRLLRDHVRSHINSYHCSECDMSCVSPSALASHIKYRHTPDAELFPCEHCDYQAKAMTDLRRHYRIHESAVFECQHRGCKFTSRTEQTLRNHTLRKHSKKDPEGRYVCHICSNRYTRGNLLTKHLIKMHDLQWPSGHMRFRYKLQNDGSYSLLTIRYETEQSEPPSKVTIDQNTPVILPAITQDEENATVEPKFYVIQSN